VLICLVIPYFDHLEQFRRVLPSLVAEGFPLVIVDDASPKHSFEGLKSLLEETAPQAILVRHDENQGKGSAVMTGLAKAQEVGFTHALQIDADGQHDINSIKTLAMQAGLCPDSLICGKPVFDSSISKLRYYSRYITLYLVWLETLSKDIQDALCGFRLYPLTETMALIKRGGIGTRMAFDPEILVRAVWAGIPLKFVPVKVIYPEDGKSHFHYLRDNLRIAWMHIRLIAGMLIRFPKLIRQNRSQKSEHKD
jgi:glycosyltransferase involved in cell wall biosynthesis